MYLLVAAAFLAAASPAAAASLESLHRSGVRAQTGLEGSGFSRLADETERDRSLRLTRRSADRAYRVASELAMIERTAAEVQGELAALARAPQDQARQDRVEQRLKFMLDALPIQTDALSWVAGVAIHIKYNLPPAGDAAYIAAVREMNSRVVEADEAGKKATSSIAQADAAAQATAGLGERAKWLSARLSAYGAEYAAYSAHVREDSAKLLAMLPGAG